MAEPRRGRPEQVPVFLWTVCAAPILDFPPGFTFAENPEDLLFGESTPSHHRPSSGEVRRSHSLGWISFQGQVKLGAEGHGADSAALGREQSPRERRAERSRGRHSRPVT
jgi:hypothetical protein